jgi:hypothetical protein
METTFGASVRVVNDSVGVWPPTRGFVVPEIEDHGWSGLPGDIHDVAVVETLIALVELVVVAVLQLETSYFKPLILMVPDLVHAGEEDEVTDGAGAGKVEADRPAVPVLLGSVLSKESSCCA